MLTLRVTREAGTVAASVRPIMERLGDVQFWQETVLPKVPATIAAPRGTMRPLGYVIMQPMMRLDRPVKAYQRWLERIPFVFANSVLAAAPAGITWPRSLGGD